MIYFVVAAPLPPPPAEPELGGDRAARSLLEQAGERSDNLPGTRLNGVRHGHFAAAGLLVARHSSGNLAAHLLHLTANRQAIHGETAALARDAHRGSLGNQAPCHPNHPLVRRYLEVFAAALIDTVEGGARKVGALVKTRPTRVGFSGGNVPHGVLRGVSHANDHLHAANAFFRALGLRTVAKGLEARGC